MPQKLFLILMLIASSCATPQPKELTPMGNCFPGNKNEPWACTSVMGKDFKIDPTTSDETIHYVCFLKEEWWMRDQECRK